MLSNTPRRLFLDIETTGPRARHDYILEVAAIAVNDDLEPSGEFREIVGLSAPAYESAIKLDNVREMHAASGLRTDVLAAYLKEPMEYHARMLLISEKLVRFVQNHFYEEGSIVLTGHSIHFDRAFVDIELRTLEPYLHYRLCDIGAFRDFLASCGVSEREIPPRPVMPHRALADVRLELQEAQQLVAAVQRQPWCPQSMVTNQVVRK